MDLTPELEQKIKTLLRSCKESDGTLLKIQKSITLI